MSKKFKVGDKVYCPMYGTSILKVFRNTSGCNLDSHPFEIVVGGDDMLTNDGKIINDVIPSIFHATPENHKALEILYGDEFEKPSVKLTSREIIQAMLARGDKSVCCWVNDISEDPTSSYSWAFIISAFDDVFIDECGTAWEFATPFNHQTRQPITELPVGEYDD